MTPNRLSGGWLRGGPVAAALSAAVVGLLAYLVDWPSVLERLTSLELRWVAAGFAATAVTIWCRSRRLELVLSEDSGHRSSNGSHLGLAAAHQAVFAVLPSGTGDAAFPFLARTFLGQSIYAGTIGLAVLRFHDIVALAAIGSVAALRHWIGGAPGAVSTLVIGCIALFVLLRTGVITGLFARAFHRMAALTVQGKPWLLPKHRLAEMSDWVSRQQDQWSSLGTAGWTLASWLSATVAVGSALVAAGLDVTASTAALILVVLNIAGAMAVITFAGLGFVEIGLAGSLAMLGLYGHQAMSAAVAIRLLLLCYNLLVPALLLAIIVPRRLSGASPRRRS